jgi:hypothetical protein
MKVTKLRTGVYKVEGLGDTFIIRGGEATNSHKWIANSCTKEEDCADDNNWAVQFDTKKELLNYAKNS